MTMRDRLFLLKPDFEDPAYPGERFYCWHCALLEGLLSSFPWLHERVCVERIAWPRPRHTIVELVGEKNQLLPLLILSGAAPEEFATGTYGSTWFVSGKDEILKVLSRRHGVPSPHP